jgi:hypothetical protein
MRTGWKVAPAIVAALAFALPLPQVDTAQAQPAGQQRPPSPGGAPPPAKPGPFKAVAITLPVPHDDPSFEAFLTLLGEIAARKDRAALAKLVVSKGFFWERESGNGADAKKSGIANLAAAIGLDNPEDPDSGWDTLAIYAEDLTVFALTDRPGVVCGPSDPGFNEDEFQALLDATKTDVSDWIYPVAGGTELRSAPRPNAPVAEKLGLVFLRLLAFDAAPDPAAADFVRVMLPSGKTGFVKAVEIASLGVSQICYLKEGNAWKIAGILGGEE